MRIRGVWLPNDTGCPRTRAAVLEFIEKNVLPSFVPRYPRINGGELTDFAVSNRSAAVQPAGQNSFCYTAVRIGVTDDHATRLIKKGFPLFRRR